MKSVYPNLDSLMEERGIDYPALAAAVGMGDTTMYRRLKGTSDWKLHEISKMCEYFGNSDVKWMFTRIPF